MKKFGIPVNNDNGLESHVSEHFGRAYAYVIVTEDKKSVETLINSSEHMGGTGKPPELLNKDVIDVLICKGLGPRAVHRFEEYGIEVYVGANGTVNNAIDLFHEGKLDMATDENACKEARHNY